MTVTPTYGPSWDKRILITTTELVECQEALELSDVSEPEDQVVEEEADSILETA